MVLCIKNIRRRAVTNRATFSFWIQSIRRLFFVHSSSLLAHTFRDSVYTIQLRWYRSLSRQTTKSIQTYERNKIDWKRLYRRRTRFPCFFFFLLVQTGLRRISSVRSCLLGSEKTRDVTIFYQDQPWFRYPFVHSYSNEVTRPRRAVADAVLIKIRSTLHTNNTICIRRDNF